MKRRIFSLTLMIVVAVILALILPRLIFAADWHDARLDAAATSIAGSPIGVYCETDWVPWIGSGHGNENGFMYPGRPWVYVSPRQCETLHALLVREDIGTYHAASALLTLAHESMHQRGGEFANCTPTDQSCEGRTECAALPLVPTLATQFFGVAPTVTDTYLVRVVKRVGKRRVATYVQRLRTIPNPWLTRLAQDALRWHHTKPAAYQGNC